MVGRRLVRRMLYRGRVVKMTRRYVRSSHYLNCTYILVQSADTSVAAKATGAMSYVSPSANLLAAHTDASLFQAFIASLTRYPQQSYIQLLNSLRDELKGKYSQKPQLSASHPMVCLRKLCSWTLSTYLSCVGLQLAVYCLICVGASCD